MMNEIKDRYIKRQAHLELLTSAFAALSVTETTYSYLNGRIREAKNEVDWLAEVCNEK